MRVTLYPQGYLPHEEKWQYLAICASGVIFEIQEAALFNKGTVIDLPDDMCMMESGWVKWSCEKDGIEYWTRTRPGGKVMCPLCGNVEECPLDATMLPYEGALGIEEDKDESY